jgi:hypothetical protein
MGWLERLRGVCSQRFFRPWKGTDSGISSRATIIAAVSATILALAAGCGNEYRPVVTPVNPTGPSGQPTAYVTVFSQPGFTPLSAGSTSPCPGTSYPNPSVITLLDFSGDSILDQAQGGNGPLTFSLESSGAQVFAPNCDGTITTSNNSAGSILTKNIQTSTLLPGAAATNTLQDSSNLYVTQEGPNGSGCPANCVAQLTGAPPALKQEIQVAPALVNLTGYGSSNRIYAISQGNSGGGTQPNWGDCDTPAAVSVTGEADAIETTSNTVSARLSLGVCPVYGFMTPDGLRAFIMNRGSGTVTVINSQLNALDPQLKTPNSTITVGAGPVFADYYRDGQILVTANYDSNSISIIDVSLDVYGNDSATFGTVLATVNLANGPGCPATNNFCVHPVEVSVLQDGSRAYVANQGDAAAGIPGSVSVVNLANYTVEKTIPLPANYYPHAIASVYSYPYGKVYVASQNSPYLTVIRTDTDTVSASPEMQGNIVDMRVTAQYPDQSSPGAANDQTESRSVGSGAP